MSTGVTGAPSWIDESQGKRFPLAFVYGLSAAGAIGVLTPLPAVIAVVLAIQAIRRGAPRAWVALGVAVLAAAVGTWLMFANPFGGRGDGL
jgi:membrane protein DedA with SNARE-associated domain